MHLILAGVWIQHELAMVWPYLPKLQEGEDVERKHPRVPSTNEVSWDWDSEYRPSYQAVALTTIDPVPALLAESHYPFRSIPGSWAYRPLLRPVLYPITDHLRLKTRILILEGSLLSLVGLQWLFIGRWLDRKGARKARLLILEPPLLISALALFAQISIVIQGELIAKLCVCVALLAWIFWGLRALWRFALKLTRSIRDQTSEQSAQ